MKNTLIAVVALAVLVLGGWYVVTKGHAPAGASTANSSETVATVNGEAITRADFNRAEGSIAAQQNIDLASTTDNIKAALKTQALDALITQALLRQAAKQAGITASTTEVDGQMQAIKTQFGSQADFDKALAAKDLTEEVLQQQLESDSMVKAYLEQQLHLSALTVTDAEAKAAYDQAAAGQQGAPPYSTVKDQAKQLALQQKQQQLIATEVQKLRAGANVKVLI